MPRLPFVSASAVLTLAGTAIASPPSLEPLVIVGESYGDMPGVVSQTQGESQINNSGQWVTRVAGTNTAGEYLGVFVIAYDGIRFDPFTPIPYEGDLTFNYPPSSPRYSSINNHGQIATTFRGLVSDPDGNVVGTRSMIAVDGSPVIRTGDTTPFGGGYGDFGSTRHILNDQGNLLANFDLFFNPFSTFETVIEFSPNESGYDQTVRRTPGMPLNDGYSVRGTSSASWGTFDLNSYGDNILGLSVTAKDLTARPAVVVNGTIRRMSGPLDAFPEGQLSLATSPVAINDSLDIAYWGLVSSSAWADGRVAVFSNEDDLIWIDDGSDPLLELSHITSATNMQLTNEGDVFWQGLIQDGFTTYSALFLNDELIATSDPRISSENILFFDGYFEFDISDNGQWIIFDTPHGIYRAMIPNPSTAALLVVCLLGSSRRRR